MPRLTKFLLSICAAAVLLVPATAAAEETPATWYLDLHHNETNFAPGETGEYWFEPINVGGIATSGPVTIRVELPPGLTVDNVRKMISFPDQSWTCDAVTGASTASCTTEGTIGPHQMSTGLILTVNVAPDASGTVETKATIEGGGPEPLTDVEPTQISPLPAGFGIVPGSFRSAFTAWDEKTPVTQAGTHPDLASFSFDFNSVDAPSPRWPDDPWQKAATEPIRDLEVVLPPGFLGNPTAVGECTPAQLGEGKCPRGSQVGRMDMTLFAAPPNAFQQFNAVHSAVYNMVHPRGAIADLAFSAAGNPVHIKASLDPAHNYAVRTTVSDINESLPPFHQKLTLWGVPIDHLHDWERCSDYGSIPWEVTTPCQTDASQKPFLTVPGDCSTDHVFTLRRYDSWVNTGAFGPDLTYPSPRPTGCEKPRFEPDVAVHPTTQTANSPTGLDVHVRVPQNESPHGLATPPVKGFVVTFPDGMTVSPSFATGLQGCSLNQIGFGTNDPVACPDASRIGSVDLSTPLLPEPLEGSMYLSNQKENPSATTFGLYVVVHDTGERGILMKLPGKLELDGQTGQITTTFDNVPQFPFDDLALKFRSGPRAPLVSPPTCGEQTIGVNVASWAQPDKPVDVSNTFDITEGPNGTPCPAGLDKRPFAPKLEAGVVNPIAGKHSDFVFTLLRDDTDQEMDRIETTLPKGLLAKIAGVTDCPDAALASISSAEETGRDELANPACPGSSQIGTLNVGMGAGSGPKYFPGKVYLAGPYKGAPLSLAVVTPAIAGPFDLGSVVVRAAIQVDPESAQVHVVSDPIPTILHGVLLRVRDIQVDMNRPQSMINPTSCAPTSVGPHVTASSGSAADLSNRFQVSDCKGLGFKPKLALRLKGGTHRGDYPALTATLKARPGDANIGRAAVTLPHSEFLAQEHIGTVCTRVQYAADACPAGSIYGYARAISPLLGEPLAGPVYLRSSDNPLPDLVASLDGRVHLDLVGRIDSFQERIRTTFSTVPDAPVTKFTLKMKGGKKGLLVNSRNLCDRPAKARVRMAAHNGRIARSAPILADPCGRGRASTGSSGNGKYQS